MTREEAINKIRQMSLPKETMDILEALAPELTMSEDEMMIYELQGFLSSFGSDYFGISEWQKFDDWLEKQKERVVDSNKTSADEDERIREAIESTIRVYGKTQGEWIGGYDMDTLVVHLREAFSTLEKQKEPLTAEEKMNHPLYLEGFDVGKKVGEVVSEQKPAGWSNEDKAMIKSILFVLESYVSQSESASSPSLITTYPTYYKEIDWLKSLRPSWKPSEQEKGALRTAIYVLREERNFPKAAGRIQAILDAFEGKESRKDWKPSEEQMRYLLAVINDPNNIGAESCYLTIKSLYNDLKKLT